MATRVEGPVWQAEGDQKRAAVQSMFAEIAPDYDRVNALLSLKRHHVWRQTAVNMLALNAGDSALDLCSGTGDFLPLLRRAVGPSGNIVGIDFCAPMLEQAIAKFHEPMALGDACRIPIHSCAVDAVSVGWGVRNVPDIDQAHREIFRILKPGGRFVSLDMAMPRNPLVRRVSKLVHSHLIPRVGARFGNASAYTYLPKSTERFMSRENLMASMQNAGFSKVRTRDLFFGNICIHFGLKP